jgi:cysteinyl-tRNA synthetase
MLKLYNSLSRSIEQFKPIDPPRVGMYTCGPTVYDFAHIGNFRTYVTSDILLRSLEFCGFTPTFVMNITDVGHLTGDNLGNADLGEDRMEKSAKKQGKSAWDIAEFYANAFFQDYEKLNLKKPLIFAKATDHIREQIVLVETLLKKGFAYQITDGVYFDTAKFPEYGKLSNLDEIKEGARVDVNIEKKNPRDFALWKFSKPSDVRQMEWDSPWGMGFPGWHIECSAMAMKYLGESIDIHVGGMDLKSTHHPNEIAQSEAATGEIFVNYWIHGAFILVDGKRMSKSLGNNYVLDDITKNGFDPLSLRYLYLQTHYRQEMNFTWASLEGAHNALKRLGNEVSSLEDGGDVGVKEYEKKFLSALENDLALPEALAVVWELINSNHKSSYKKVSLLKMDQVLGLNLGHAQRAKLKAESEEIADEIRQLVIHRDEARKQGQFKVADKIRDEIIGKGYEVEDQDGKTVVKKR